nr:hypothetical protein [Paenibacillus hamazuiensis]
MVHRTADEIEECARRLQQHVNSPQELQMELLKIQSCIDSLGSLTRNESAGANAKTAQLTPNQNQS